MSAGSTVNSTYETTNNVFYRCKVQPETLTLVLNGQTNAAGAGSPGTDTPSAKMSGGRRELGVNARLVRMKFDGALPPGYKMDGILTLPILTPAVFAAIGVGDSGTYSLNGTDYAVEVTGKTPETIR